MLRQSSSRTWPYHDHRSIATTNNIESTALIKVKEKDNNKKHKNVNFAIEFGLSASKQIIMAKSKNK